jgi:hypothetical protein
MQPWPKPLPKSLSTKKERMTITNAANLFFDKKYFVANPCMLHFISSN